VVPSSTTVVPKSLISIMCVPPSGQRLSSGADPVAR
jgi:hypothetical protein